MVDSKARVGVKSAIWGICGTVVMYCITLLVTGNQTQTLAITCLYGVGRVVIYLVYELVWSRVTWGVS